jgi:hypothetical protein
LLLIEKIRHNSATLNDYYDFERILAQNGVTKNELMTELFQRGINGWEQYLIQRGKAQTYQERRELGQILGGILGLAGGILASWLIYKAIKK